MRRKSAESPSNPGPQTKISPHVSAASMRALTSAGFAPVGVVFGNSTVHLARPMSLGTESRFTGAWRGFRGDSPEEVPPAIRSAQGWTNSDTEGPETHPFIASYPCPHGRGRQIRRTSGHFTGFNFEIPGPGLTLGQRFENALERLTAGARQRGAHGVIDVAIRLDGDEMLHGAATITLTGTAVAHVGTPPGGEIFSTTVSAQGLTKLLTAGPFPTTLSFGAVLLSGWTGCGARAALDSGFSTQVGQLAGLMTQARDLATSKVVLGCAGSDLVIDSFLTHAFHRASKTDYRVAAWASGSGTRRFAGPEIGEPATPAVLMEQR
jgi:hypothetical protein